MNTTPEPDRTDPFGGPETLLTAVDPPLRANLRRTLNRAGYRTIEEVVVATDAELLALRGIGKFSVRVLREVLDHQAVRQPLERVPLDALRNELRNRILNLLKRAGYRTAEEVALVTNADLLDLHMLGEPSLSVLRNVTSGVLAKNYTSRKPVTLTAPQVGEIVAVIAELVPYADRDHHRDLRRRARALLDKLAPGFPTSETSRHHLFPETADDIRPPLVMVKADPHDAEQEPSVLP